MAPFLNAIICATGKPCVHVGAPPPKTQPNSTVKCVFPCGRDTTTETLRSVFTQFGELEDAVVTTDRVTGKSKGYGFITFRYAAGASAAIAEPEKQLDVSMLAQERS